MKTVTTFFASRTLARNAVEALNGKVKDFGSTAAKGERWAVIHEEAETVMEEQIQVQEKASGPGIGKSYVPADEIKAQIALLARSVQNNNSTVRVINRRRMNRSHAVNLKGKTIPVTTYHRPAA